MLQFGQNLISAIPEQLRKVQLEDIVKYIKEGAFNLKEQIDLLHKIMSLDPKKYQDIKRKLPYFTSSIFFPAYRKTENFAFAEYFVVDIDHLLSKNTTAQALKDKLKDNQSINLCFISPSGDGLKIVFKLSEKFTDPVKYSMFYKLFVKKFSNNYNLEQVVDTRTSDVARVCFLSYDPLLIYNTNPDTINPNAYINFNSALEIETAEELIKEIDDETKSNEPKIQKQELAPDILNEIKSKLNPKIKTKKENAFFVPEKINLLEKVIAEKANELGISISSRPISYGKQITFSVATHKGELNVFYGKKGYSVIKSSKTGCSSEMNDIAYKLVCDIIF